MDEKYPLVRLEGRNGLLLALSPEGKPVPADEAIKGEEYTCPFCGIRMHQTHTKTNEAIFAKNPGSVHKDPHCIAIEKSETNDVVLIVSPEDFIASLCAPVMATGPKSPSVGNNPPTTGNNPPSPGKPTGPKPVQLKNLEQIFKTGIHLMKPEENRFGFTVGDLVLSYVWFDRFLETAGEMLGPLIVYAVFVPRSPKSGLQKNLLLFKIFKKSKNKSESKFMYFGLFCRTNEDYSRIAQKCIRKEKNGDRTTKKGREGLIACADWRKMPMTNCRMYCGSEEYCDQCGGMYVGNFTNNNQVYAVPEKMRTIKK